MFSELGLVLLLGLFFNLYLRKRGRVRELENTLSQGKRIARRRLNNLIRFIKLLQYSKAYQSRGFDFFLRGFDTAVDILVEDREPEAILMAERPYTC